MGSSRASIIVVALAALVPWNVARADCSASPAVDDCLVGTWQQTGGGPAEWMRQHMKSAQITVTANKALFTFKANGTFSTSKVDATAQVTAKDGEMQATTQMSAQASGQWSAAGGRLTLCNTALNSQGTMELKLPGGKIATVPIPQTQGKGTTMDYSCAGDTFSTVQPMPMNSSITTVYTRVR
jgi:FlaG/FlaF family flagellin (archaellin)